MLGAFYLRLVGTPADIYQYLEPLYNDYRKIRLRLTQGERDTQTPAQRDKYMRVIGQVPGYNSGVDHPSVVHRVVAPRPGFRKDAKEGNDAVIFFLNICRRLL